jgi:hypothetical protein
MAKIKWLVITALLLLNTASATVLQVSATTAGMTPGRAGVITLSLANLVTDIAYDTKVVLKGLNAPLTSDSVCNECELYSNAQQLCIRYEERCYSSVGDIYGGNSQDISFSVNVPEEIESGVYIADFEIHYESLNITSGASEDRKMTKKVAFSVESAHIKPDVNVQSISVPEEINPGEDFNLILLIENTGEVKAREVNVELITTDFSSKGQTNKVLVGDLNTNEAQNITYSLLSDSSLRPGVYDIGISITYSDESINYDETSSFGVSVGGATEFSVFIQNINPELITQDSDVSVILSIANIGVVDAESVSVSLNPSQGLSLGNINEDFLGDLDTGDFTTTSFTFNPDSEGELNLNLTLSYATPNGQRVSFDTIERITLEFEQPVTQQIPTDMIGWIVLIAVVIVIAYFFFRARKKK